MRNLSAVVLFLLTNLLFMATTIAGDPPSKNNTQFVLDEMCDGEESINQGCSIVVDGVRSLMDCARTCWPDTECVGASLDAQGRCLHHQLCHTSMKCATGPDVGSNTHRYMARHCVHGMWDISTQSCVCCYGTFGDRCNRYHSNCDSLVTAGFETGVHQVILDLLEDGKNLTKILCSIATSNVTTVRPFVNRGKIDFNRKWNDYVNGFMVNRNNEWAGLRALRVLGQAGFKYFETVYRFDNGFTVGSLYKDFLVGNREDGYPFTCVFIRSKGSTPSGNFTGDCLSPLQGVPFSTWDRDQDGSMGENCASLAGSGWWYKDGCDIPCNLLGPGLDYGNTPTPQQRLNVLGVGVDLIRIIIYK